MGGAAPPGRATTRDETVLPVVIGLNAVIVAVTDEEPRVLTVAADSADGPAFDDAPTSPESWRAPRHEAIPFGPLDPARDRTLELALRGWVREQAKLELGYVEQLYTFGDKNRDPRERLGGPRVLSIGYLSLVQEDRGAGAQWRDWYLYLPWEDWRSGRPKVLGTLAPALEGWAALGTTRTKARARRERIDIAFGLGGAPWDPYRVLDRYELLYEAGLVAEAQLDRGQEADPGLTHGRPLRFDHRRILATAIQRLRGKIKYRPVVFELLPATFTLLQLQRVVEALAGQRLHKQNFRRLVERGGMVEGTGERAQGTGGRPAELFRFRRDVLRERPTPGVGLPSPPKS
ncbi:MAG: hypothetical protein AAGM22_29805 [Acidobacteriota bacterium]